ncbi:MAG: hypothetical protein VCD66_14460 [Alphaproteobacteria bacterium]
MGRLDVSDLPPPPPPLPASPLVSVPDSLLDAEASEAFVSVFVVSVFAASVFVASVFVDALSDFFVSVFGFVAIIVYLPIPVLSALGPTDPVYQYCHGFLKQNFAPPVDPNRQSTLVPPQATIAISRQDRLNELVLR